MKDLLKFIGIITPIALAFYAWHYDIVTDLRSDYGEKLNALEREKDDAINERDLYFNYLVSIPDSVIQLQEEINKKKQENFDLTTRLESQNTNTDESYSSSAYLNKGSTFKDERTGLVVGLLDVYRTDEDVTQAEINISLPTGEESRMQVVAGDSYYFKFDDNEYRLIVSETNWYGDTIDIDITDEIKTVKLVRKKYLFEPETLSD